MALRVGFLLRRLSVLLLLSLLMVYFLPREPELILHLTWKTKTLPDWAIAPVESCRSVNGRDFRIVLYSDADNRRLVAKHVPQHLAVFDSMSGITQSDFARLLYMHAHGGLYIDLDVFCVLPFLELFNELIKTNASLGLGHLELAAHDHADALPNAVLLAVRPGHPFWMEAIALCATNAQLRPLPPVEQVANSGVAKFPLYFFKTCSSGLWASGFASGAGGAAGRRVRPGGGRAVRRRAAVAARRAVPGLLGWPAHCATPVSRGPCSTARVSGGAAPDAPRSHLLAQVVGPQSKRSNNMNIFCVLLGL